jgi:hypothetical protein
MTITFPVALATRLTHSLTRKTHWADAQESWLAKREASAERSKRREEAAAIAVDVHAQFAAAQLAARGRPQNARKPKQQSLFANFIKHPSTITDDEPHDPMKRTPAAQARHERSKRVIPDSDSDNEAEPALTTHPTDSPPAPVAQPPPHDPPNQETGRGRQTKRLRRETDVQKRRERKRKYRHESQCEHNDKMIRQAEAKAAQALEGVKRRAQKKKKERETKQAEKEKNAKRTRRAQGGGGSTRSRGSDGTGVQRGAEEGGAGGRDSHTAGHRNNAFGDG